MSATLPSGAPQGYNKKVSLLISCISSTRPKSSSFLFLRTIQTMHLAHTGLPERMWAPSLSPADSLAFQKLQGLFPGTQHLQPSSYFHIHPFLPPAVFWAPQAPGISRGSTLERGERQKGPLLPGSNAKGTNLSSV